MQFWALGSGFVFPCPQDLPEKTLRSTVANSHIFGKRTHVFNTILEGFSYFWITDSWSVFLPSDAFVLNIF